MKNNHTNRPQSKAARGVQNGAQGRSRSASSGRTQTSSKRTSGSGGAVRSSKNTGAHTGKAGSAGQRKGNSLAGVGLSRRTGAKKTASSNKEMNLLIVLVLTALVVISIIAGAIKESMRTTDDAAGESSITDDSGSVSESLQGTATDINIEDDEVTTAIVSLIRQYRSACASADVETIAKLYNVTELRNETTFMAVSSIITGYQNTECYIREGLDDVSRVVFVYDDLKLADFDTLVPNLSYLYVRAAADGSFYIYPGVYNEETMSYEYEDEILDHIDNLEGDIEISELIKDVNQKFSDTCDANKNIKEFIDKLIAANNASEKETVKDTSAQKESESESESASDTSDTLDTTDTAQTDTDDMTADSETDLSESDTSDTTDGGQ